jgi:hypothetical protein
MVAGGEFILCKLATHSPCEPHLQSRPAVVVFIVRHLAFEESAAVGQ